MILKLDDKTGDRGGQNDLETEGQWRTVTCIVIYSQRLYLNEHFSFWGEYIKSFLCRIHWKYMFSVGVWRILDFELSWKSTFLPLWISISISGALPASCHSPEVLVDLKRWDTERGCEGPLEVGGWKPAMTEARQPPEDQNRQLCVTPLQTWVTPAGGQPPLALIPPLRVVCNALCCLRPSIWNKRWEQSWSFYIPSHLEGNPVIKANSHSITFIRSFIWQYSRRLITVFTRYSLCLEHINLYVCNSEDEGGALSWMWVQSLAPALLALSGSFPAWRSATRWRLLWAVLHVKLWSPKTCCAGCPSSAARFEMRGWRASHSPSLVALVPAEDELIFCPRPYQKFWWNFGLRKTFW